MAEVVQLGLLRLDLSSGPSSPELTWKSLTIDRLKGLVILDKSRPLQIVLMGLLGDPGVGLLAEYRIDENGCLVRVTLTPSDSKDSLWKRTSNDKGKRKDHLRTVFSHLREGWEGEEGRYMMDRLPEDHHKMSGLYAALPSPVMPAFAIEAGQSGAEQEVYLRLMDHEEPEGIQTSLYKYQFRSVARMLQMETNPGKLIDPLFVPFRESGREGLYYVNTTTFDIQRHPGWYQLPQGGILCEQMGVGKTLMCITLIVSTLATPPVPPLDAIETSPAMSEHSLAHFPFEPHVYARERSGIRPPPFGIPSLAELCGEVLNRRDASAQRAAYLSVPAEEILTRSLFYLTYPSNHLSYRGARYHQRKESVQKKWLAKSTLVVVPQILIEQWKLEILKHVTDGTLKVLELGKEVSPPIQTLMAYDVILMSLERFGLEDTGYRAKRDQCPSEFMKARWKRIILDEGHVASNKLSNAMQLARDLSIERRWIVSGTPTKHLQQGGEVEMESFNILANQEKATSSPKHLAWSRRDIDDATRIGAMVGGFLAAEPFRSESNFQDQVTKHLRHPQGPAFGAVGRLRYIMGAMMVKHAPKVIDEEASLPASTLSVEMLQFDPMQRITYNVLIALIASNVYTSNFEDPDYFLHPRNATSFNTVVQNLHLACFWYSAYEMGAAECLHRTRTQLETNSTLTTSGRKVLEEAVAHLETALATPGWEEWMTNGVSLPFEAEAIPNAIKDAWSDSMYTHPDLIDAKSLHTLRDLNTPGRTVHDLHMRGWESRAIKHPDFFEEMDRVAQRAKRSSDGQARREDKKKAGVKAAAHSPTSAKHFKNAPSKSKRKSDNPNELEARLEQASRNAAMVTTSRPLCLPSDPLPLPTSIKTKSRSAKLNYVLQSVLSSTKDDKFVIFGDKYELGHVSEALDLVDVKSCFAGTTVSSAQRVQALQDFEKPDTKVCLLDLRQGARGLNLVFANRMIFISPVWNLDVQAQAIKRIHRIGQTKPTKVEILVTKGTFEEDIAERSSLTRTQKDEQLYSRALIENPSFVYAERGSNVGFNIRFSAQPYPGLSSPIMSSSSGSRPITPMPVTPTTARSYEIGDMIIVASRDEIGPSPSRLGSAEKTSSNTRVQKRSVAPTVYDEHRPEEITPKRKKGRVAFA